MNLGAAVLLIGTGLTLAGARIEQRDVDGDGRADVVLANDLVTLAVAPHRGAQAIRFTTRDGFQWTSLEPDAFGLFVDMDTKLTWPGALARATYAHEVLSKGPAEAAVRFRCVSSGKGPRHTKPELVGLVYHKTIRVRRGRPDVEVHVRIENPTPHTRRADYWQQSIFSASGRKGHDVCVRPDVTGLSLVGGRFGPERQWVHTPAAGWSAMMSDNGQRAMLFLVDYHELKTLYNCVGSVVTAEYMFASAVIPPGKSWQTTIRAVPVLNLGRPIHIGTPVACGMDVDLAPSPPVAVFRVAATAKPFQGVRVKAKLIDRTDGSRSKALTAVAWKGPVTWQAVKLKTPLPALDPTRDYGIHVTLWGGWGGGGSTAVSLPLTVRSGDKGTLLAEVGVGPGFNRGAPRRVRKLLKPDDLPGLRRRLRNDRLGVLVVADGAQGARGGKYSKRRSTVLARRWHLDEAAALVGKHKLDRVYYRRSGWQCAVDDFPTDYDALFRYDVIVLECQDSVAMGPTTQAMLVDYVRAGGGLVVLGGYDSFGKGRSAGSVLLDVMPVTIDGPWDLVPCRTGRFQVDPKAPGGDLKWAVPPKVPWIQQVKPRDGTRVVARVDGRPAIVLGSAGKGRTVAVAAAPLAGDGTLRPLVHDCPAFPKLMARLVAWAAGGTP